MTLERMERLSGQIALAAEWVAVAVSIGMTAANVWLICELMEVCQ